MTTLVSTDKFEYNSKMKLLSSEASLLIGYNMRSQVFPDSCDEGFTLVNAKTGSKTIWLFKSETKVDGEIVSWEFEPYSKKAYGHTMIIFND